MSIVVEGVVQMFFPYSGTAENRAREAENRVREGEREHMMRV